MSQDDAFSSYKSPLSSRYSSDYMKYLYSDRYKFQTWRKLWTILAKAQHDLGLSTVSQESVNLLKENINNIDFEQAKKEEKKLRHDVMAHVHTFKSCVEKDGKGGKGKGSKGKESTPTKQTKQTNKTKQNEPYKQIYQNIPACSFQICALA